MPNEWDPDNDKKQDQLIEESLKMIRHQNEEFEARSSKSPISLGSFEPPKPPTLDEEANRCKKLWEKVKSIAPDAPERVQAIMFDMFRYTRDEEDSTT